MALVGIDVGNANCKIAIREGNGLRLVAERMPDNMVRGDDVVSPESMSRFLQDVRKNSHVRERNCALVLSTSQVYFRHVTLPPMTTAELMLNLPYEFRDYISGDPEEYIYDYAVDELEHDEDGQLRRMGLYAAAVSKSLMETYAQMLRKGGFKLKIVMPAPMAYMRLLSSYYATGAIENPDDHDVMIVDIGHANMGISLFRGLRFDSARTIDFGCDEFDNAIASMKGIDPYTASSYKFSNYENVLDEPECMAVCDRFALEVSKVVNFYNFNNPEREIGHVCFTGGGASIRQLTDAIANAVEVPVLELGTLLPDSVQGIENAPSCALAYAALLEGEAM